MPDERKQPVRQPAWLLKVEDVSERAAICTVRTRSGVIVRHLVARKPFRPTLKEEHE